jgi:hypothetical protein
MFLSLGYVSWILFPIWIQSEWDETCSLVTLLVPGFCGTYSDIWFMNTMQDLDSVLWRQQCSRVTLRIPDLCGSQCRIRIMNIMQYLNSVSRRQTVSNGNYIFRAYVVLRTGYNSWLLFTFWIQSEGGQVCSLVKLCVPGVCGTYSDICLNKNLHDLDSV